MSGRKSTFFYGVLIALASLVVGMVIASRLDLTPASMAGTLSVPATNSAPLTGTLDASTFRTIAHDAGPSVVSVVIQGTRPVQSFGDFFNFIIPGDPSQGGGGRNRGRQQQQQPQREEPVQGAGSGFIIDKSGFILTNNHVVDGATRIEVFLSSMDEQNPLEEGLPAKVVGRDELTDTALIQLTAMPKDPLIAAKFGDSDQLAPGDWVMAIGNPFQLSNTVTVGVVSAVGRDTPGAVVGRPQQMIQTDAAINRGNSGGPLLNIRGEVVGINTQIVSNQDSGGNLGIGFAIPINMVREILPGLREGKVTRGRIGLSVMRTPITKDVASNYGLPSTQGAIVGVIIPDGPAAKAGIKVDDVITQFNGKAVKDNGQLVDMVMHTAPGTTVPVELYRNKKAMTVNVKVEPLDLAQEQEQAGQAVRGGRQQEAPRNEPRDTAFGMQLREITPGIAKDLNLPAGKGAAVISSVDPLGSAFRANLQPGDVVLGLDGATMTTLDQVTQALDKVAAGQTVRVRYLRDGNEGLALLRRR